MKLQPPLMYGFIRGYQISMITNWLFIALAVLGAGIIVQSIVQGCSEYSARKKAVINGASLIYEHVAELTIKEIAIKWSNLEGSNFSYPAVWIRLVQSFWKGDFGDEITFRFIDDMFDADKNQIIPRNEILKLRKFSNGDINNIRVDEKKPDWAILSVLDVSYYGDIDHDTYTSAYLNKIVLTKKDFIEWLKKSDIQLPKLWKRK